MAASYARRDVAYFTFGDEQLRDDVFNMYSVLVEKKISIGQLYQMLCQYGEQYGETPSPPLDLYGYLYAVLDTLDSDGVMDFSDSSDNSSATSFNCPNP